MKSSSLLKTSRLRVCIPKVYVSKRTVFTLDLSSKVSQKKKDKFVKILNTKVPPKILSDLNKSPKQFYLMNKNIAHAMVKIEAGRTVAYFPTDALEVDIEIDDEKLQKYISGKDILQTEDDLEDDHFLINQIVHEMFHMWSSLQIGEKGIYSQHPSVQDYVDAGITEEIWAVAAQFFHLIGDVLTNKEIAKQIMDRIEKYRLLYVTKYAMTDQEYKHALRQFLESKDYINQRNFLAQEQLSELTAAVLTRLWRR